MPEMLVHLFSKYPKTDPTFDAYNGRGDVEVVNPDGYVWSAKERELPDFIIIRANVPMAKARTMLSAEQGDPIANPLLYVRQFTLDLDALAGMGVPIPREDVAREMRFPAVPARSVAAAPEHPMLAVIDELKTGARRKEYTPRQSSIVTITESQFDAAKKMKPPLVDPSIIRRPGDPGVIK